MSTVAHWLMAETPAPKGSRWAIFSLHTVNLHPTFWVPHLIPQDSPITLIFHFPRNSSLFSRTPKKRKYMYFHLFQGMEQTHPQAGEGERQMDTKLERISYSGDGTNKVLRLRM